MFIVNFVHTSKFFLLFHLLTLNRLIFTGLIPQSGIGIFALNCRFSLDFSMLRRNELFLIIVNCPSESKYELFSELFKLVVSSELDQKQPFRNVHHNSCSRKSPKVHKKKLAIKFLFWPRSATLPKKDFF